MKYAELVPVHKKNSKHDKENYRRVSILSKLYSQLYNYFENTLFPSQLGFRKGYSAQHCLQLFNEAIDRGDKFSGLLTDLSKAFDSINHLLLTSNLTVTEFHLCQLKLFSPI